MIQLNILYKPKKHFFEMNIDELKEYVYKCKYIDDVNKKLIKNTRRKKRKTRRKKNTRRKKI